MHYIHPLVLTKIIAKEALDTLDIDYDGREVIYLNQALADLEIDIDYLGIEDDINELFFKY